MMQIANDLLKDKKIALAVSGSIAAYKAVELARLFYKAGADVRVVMTPSATKFVTPLTFEAITANKVLLDSNEDWSSDHNHIGLSSWADTIVIAPATANTIAKLANAIADNILLQTLLAFNGKKIIAPAANTNMISHPITQANIKMLGIADYEFVGTQTKELACRTTGDGALAEPLEIFYESARVLLRDEFWADRRVIVTGGGTIEKIDDVRYISNFSSGKMASALATALYLRGADVNLIATRFESNLPKGMHTIDVESTEEMLEYLQDSIRVAKKGKLSKPTLMREEHIHLIQKKPYLFMAAAVSDYTPLHPQNGKLKKDILGEEWQLTLKKNVDILKSIDKEGIVTIGFKAEMDAKNAKENAKKMLQTKDLDAVCLNILKNSSDFGKESNEIEFITSSNEKLLPNKPKLSLAFEIIDKAKGLE
ncbi:Phosphopantothenoylcysteine decarboxylase / Phosphopantothenoylcysteine synthetase [hydrothermal vent metagenome]|uniref:Phosphopantothenoylcysteine decarboxylase / Phosphopantothenoylcysteine synthetase n=1 Tax=hydrothermal vent metagenome TaxID=652676 RepID=A0A1W1BPM1_9ZZZZ